MMTNRSRREFLQKGGALLSVAAITTTTATSTSAAELPLVDPAGAQAKALAYVDDASTVDAAKYPRYKDGQACVNCALYTGASDSEEGPCGVFPGKAVNANGWCNVYAPKA